MFNNIDFRKIIRNFLLLLLCACITLFIVLGVNSVKNLNKVTNRVVPIGWSLVFPKVEFSSVICADNFIYAGGAQGVYKINPVTKEATEIKNSEKSFYLVGALYYDENSGLWIGHNDGISILKDQMQININKSNGLPHNQVTDFLKKDTTTVYASTFGGVAEIENNKVKTVLYKKDGLPEDTIETMYKDDKGWTWMGAYTAVGGGVLCFKGSEKYIFNRNNGLVHNNITRIVQTNDNRIIIGGGIYTSGGATIFKYNGDKWIIADTITKSNGLAGEKVRNIYVDGNNNIWYCSEYEGIAVFKANGNIVKLTEKDGLSNNEVKRIVEDNKGNFWLATKSGLTYIEQKAVQDLIGS